ncbi:transcriptional repressor [Dactylosporangium siamense]|uniref:Transcriptional repressor n=2 Tax=Dactylosporangium siamense TaxID=685454 RepID=A0A919PMS1_9ACTN|nr:transcriptional repressor [Dactylosporangium siamense]
MVGPPERRHHRTRQRREVLDLLAATDEFISAKQVHTRLRERGSTIGLTTVYRTVQALAEAGEVDTLRLGTGEQHYRRCRDDHHHHHLTCRHCARTVEVTGPAVEAWARQVAAAHGYAEVNHTLELFGTCADCRPAAG